MNTLLLDMPVTAARSEQLVAASERTTHDPFQDIDWNTPIDDSAFHMPPELLALYGTETWEAMSEAERITYSRHETAAMFGSGIWFENALMQIVLHHLTEIDVKDPMHRYLLTEVADECRHSMMFGEFIRRAGTPSYGPTREVTIEPGRGGRAMSYIAILAIEELLDYANRATMRDDRLHPVTRQISKLHVLEEARHVSFAKSYLTECLPTLDADEKAFVRAVAPDLVAEIVALSLDPAVFEELGVEGGHAIAKANPNYQTNVVAGLAKLTSFLADVGVIDEREPWLAHGLIEVQA
ncbi:MAG: hypothetical protein ACI9C1_000675 [Candidatus Aldehydirespiratoraceae bacterium]|jgi:hypothetical protein